MSQSGLKTPFSQYFFKISKKWGGGGAPPPRAQASLALSWEQITEIRKQSNGLVSPKIVEQGGVPLKNVVTGISQIETDKLETGLPCV